jgi:hypothetical protein
MSVAEVFFRPETVASPGPIAPQMDRVDCPPCELDLGDDLSAVVAATPGFRKSNFPLRDMLEQAEVYGAYRPERPIVRPVELDADGRRAYDGLRVTGGEVRNRMSAMKTEAGHKSWLHHVGISPRGLNLLPAYVVGNVRPGREYTLRITLFYRSDEDFRLTPVAVTGCRLATHRHELRPATVEGRAMETLSVRFRARAKQAVILLLHNGRDLNERASIGRIELLDSPRTQPQTRPAAG